MHDMVAGTTPSGEAYCANDPELLIWVESTAAYGFLQAYHAYVRPLSLSERDCYYAEGIAAAALYGATSAPRSAPITRSEATSRASATQRPGAAT